VAKARKLTGPIKAFALTGPIKAHVLIGEEAGEELVGNFAAITILENQSSSGYFDCANTPIPVDPLSQVETSIINLSVAIAVADTVGLIFENSRSGERLITGGCGFEYVGSIRAQTNTPSATAGGIRYDSAEPFPDQIVQAIWYWNATTVSGDWQAGDSGLIYRVV